METNELFAKNLTKLRKDKGITQLELANVLNFTDRNISKWENGQSLPSIDILLILSSYFTFTRTLDCAITLPLEFWALSHTVPVFGASN